MMDTSPEDKEKHICSLFPDCCVPESQCNTMKLCSTEPEYVNVTDMFQNQQQNIFNFAFTEVWGTTAFSVARGFTVARDHSVHSFDFIYLFAYRSPVENSFSI